MGLSIGIVGLPNVGKSTIFNALTRAQNAEAANYPFCTIEANKAIVPVPDPRVDAIAELSKPQKVTRATVDFVDIAGLVRGASQGEGLGNQFLANIREADAILHVVRCFEDENIAHVEGDVNPIRDIEIIETELILSDLQRMENRIERMTKMARSEKEGRDLLERAKALHQHIADGNPVFSFKADPSEMMATFRKEMQFLSDKKVIYCCNVDEAGLAEGNVLVAAVRDYATTKGCETVSVSARMEEEMIGLDDSECTEFMESFGITESGLNQIVHTGYRTLGLLSYFTAGPKEVRAWNIRDGWKAPQAAGVIHTDFERGFIRAQVITFADYVEHGGEAPCKALGLMRQEGKEYCVQDGDVILFLFNV
ncbi:MAG: redox-regulated ATPase YchF [Verrucomicrobia bacterium]|jgi:ribosome-binding ATPase|nr:redox-regulated ATPase YchF [Verrucomicrobiota bacterium]